MRAIQFRTWIRKRGIGAVHPAIDVQIPNEVGWTYNGAAVGFDLTDAGTIDHAIACSVTDEHAHRYGTFPTRTMTLANIGKAAEFVSYLEEAVTILEGLAQNETDIAKKYLLRARDLLRQLEARSALSEFDRKMLNEIETAAK